MHKHIHHLLDLLSRHKKMLIVVMIGAVMVPSILVVVCFFIIDPYKKYILSSPQPSQAQVGLVLGAGITKDGRPFRELQARLDSAAQALQNGTVNKLILSGDNRFKHYDEPSAMLRYLTEQRNIPAEKLITDYAGRSTYESCERAAKVFELKKVILFSARSHLPRALYLCRHFNLEAYGIANNLEANNGRRRELQANVKAVYNVYIKGEPTVLGPSLPLFE